MKKTKRLFTLLLSLTLIFASFPTSINASNGRGGDDDDDTYTVKVQVQKGGQAFVEYTNENGDPATDTYSNTNNNNGMETRNYTVKDGGMVRVTFTALPGYEFRQKEGAHDESNVDNIYYDHSVGSNRTVVGQFDKIPTRELEVITEPGGSYTLVYVAPDGSPMTVNETNNGSSNTSETYELLYKSSMSLTFAPQLGYSFDGAYKKNNNSWSGVNNPYTDNQFKNDRTIKGTFSLIEYTVTASSSAGGTATVNGNGSYTGNYNDGLNFVETADEGFEFVEWRMDDENGVAVTPPTALTADGDYYAVFAAIPQFDISVDKVGEGTVSVNGEAAITVYRDTPLTFVADPAPGYRFAGWEPSIPETALTDGTYVATFIEQIDVDIDVDPGEGGTATVDGVSAVTVDTGTSVVLSATANPHYNFVGWYVGNQLVSEDNPYSPSVTEDTTFEAVFVLDDHDVTVTAIPSSGGTATVNGLAGVTVGHGDQVNLIATPDSANHYVFVGWFVGEDLVSSNTLYQPSIIEDMDYEAVFKLDDHDIVVTVTGNGTGQVDGDSSAVVDHGETYELVASPAAHNHFVGWFVEDVLYSTDLTITETSLADVSYEARFAKDQHTVAVSTEGGGTVTVDGLPSVTKDYNTKVYLVAVPDEGFKFVKWTRDWDNDSTKSTSPNTTTRTKFDKSFTAVFAPKDAFTVTLELDDPVHTYGTIDPNLASYYEGEDVDVTVGTNGGNTTITSIELIEVIDGVEQTPVIVPGPVVSLENLSSDWIVRVHSLTEYTVYTESENLAEGSTSPLKQTVKYGDEATVVATPESGFRFVGWYTEGEQSESEQGPLSGLTLVSTLATYTFEVEGTTWLLGVFEPIPVVVTTSTPVNYTLTVNVVGGGSVPGFTGTNTFSSGTNVNLAPQADEGFVFVGWSGDTGSLNGNLVVVNGNIELTATFEAIIEETIVPEGTPDSSGSSETDVILDEEITEGVPTDIPDQPLPQTGGIPIEGMAALGTALIGFGAKLRKRK